MGNYVFYESSIPEMMQILYFSVAAPWIHERFVNLLGSDLYYWTWRIQLGRECLDVEVFALKSWFLSTWWFIVMVCTTDNVWRIRVIPPTFMHARNYHHHLQGTTITNLEEKRQMLHYNHWNHQYGHSVEIFLIRNCLGCYFALFKIIKHGGHHGLLSPHSRFKHFQGDFFVIGMSKSIWLEVNFKLDD